MDPTTGFVQAMVSYPSYDPNLFSCPVSDTEYAALTDAESKQPLYTNALTPGLYPPGSHHQALYLPTPALENGIVTRYSVFPVSDQRK